MIYFLSFIVVLGILIFVHEFGHFIVARKLGVGVTKFSFGFGPKLFGVQRGETEYLVSAIPLGGYVKLIGESETEEVPPGQVERSFSHKPIWVKMAVVAAGPIGNLLFAVLVFWVVFLGGVPSLTTKIGDVLPDTPAARAGILKGDLVVRIDGDPVTNWEELATRIKSGSPGRPLSFTLLRDGKEMTIPVSPEMREGRSLFGEKISEPKVGIAAGQEVVYQEIGIADAFLRSGVETGKLIYLTGMTVVKLITRVLPSETLGGPILIAQIAGDQARQGISPFAYFLGLLSVNLGILNLLPIPILDGGHLLFFCVEGLMRKPISPKARAVAHQVGLALILMLTALV
ncbi:MAG: zinc metalloprotease, partial [Deltaproteobacteria bacterium]|nr:zinc metalloprotease [Deltaproteobacteria bacterium]